MATASILIGNEDNKLTQTEWAEFCQSMDQLIDQHAKEVHFRGGSPWDASTQSGCWVCDLDEAKIESLKSAIAKCRKQFRQDSAAVVWGETEFI